MKTYNSIIAETFVQTLFLGGIRHIYISPGSRSTPLTLAFARNAEKFSSINMVYDERSAAFQALGCALATGRPTVLVCTSGSAVANYFPAVAEASQSEIPMLILSADRPFELQDSGANQTMNQKDIFGKFVKKFVEMPIADNPQWLTEGKLRDFIRMKAAMGIAHSIQHPQGPVHFNFPFRKPLEPLKEEKTDEIKKKQVQITMGHLSPSEDQINLAIRLISEAERPLMILGPNAWRAIDMKIANRFSKIMGIPIISDILSGRKITAHEIFLASKKVREALQPDLIIRIGKVPIGKQMGRFLEETEAVSIQISESLRLHDDHLKMHYFFNASPNIFFNKIIERVEPKPLGHWFKKVEEINNVAKEQLKQIIGRERIEGIIVGNLLNSLNENNVVFLGNSLIVRHAMTYAIDCKAAIYGNRGVSGIDGNISTALGIAKGLQKEVVAIVGDLTFIHDLNALSSKEKRKLTVIVLNNHGGGIFRRLPISKEKEFHQFFLTPHEFTFAKVADFFGMKYHKIESDIPSPETIRPNSLIEIITDSQKDNERQKQIIDNIAHLLEERI